MRVSATRELAKNVLRVFCVLSLLSPLAALPVRAEQPPKPERMHPLLSKTANEKPNHAVRIVVQVKDPGGELGSAIDRLGGKGKKALPLIKAYAAEMPAGKVRALAQNPNVNWVTIDAPMVSTAGGPSKATPAPTVPPMPAPTASSSTSSAPRSTLTPFTSTDPSSTTWTSSRSTSTSATSVTSGDWSQSTTVSTSGGSTTYVTETDISDASLATDYPVVVGATSLWDGTTRLTGSGVTVAVVDSGINGSLPDFSAANGSRVVASVKYSSTSSSNTDTYGHGTHVAGIIAGNGRGSGGKYIGIAPDANLVNIKVSDAKGMAYLSDVIDGLQWILLNREACNIRVVNLSLVSSVPESYKTSPLNAAVELLWLSGIVVVTSSGNKGADSLRYPPANDPFVITVGAVDTAGTTRTTDDAIATWSGYGTTQDGFSKPDLVAPGRRIVSNLSSASNELAKLYPDRVVDRNYIRLSGTSMAAPVVSGVAALLIQANPSWTPDQVKSALMATAKSLRTAGSGAGDVYAPSAVSVSNPSYANQGIPFNSGVAGVASGSVYDAATWDSATWDSATWDSATWDSATWDSAAWDSATWNSVQLPD